MLENALSVTGTLMEQLPLLDILFHQTSTESSTSTTNQNVGDSTATIDKEITPKSTGHHIQSINIVVYIALLIIKTGRIFHTYFEL